MILSFLLYWLLTALILIVVANVIPGVSLEGFGAALLASLIIGLINMSLKPVLFFLTLPITILTLGLFALVLNALLFVLAAWLAPGFGVSGFWSAFFAAILFALFTSLLNMLDLKFRPT